MAKDKTDYSKLTLGKKKPIKKEETITPDIDKIVEEIHTPIVEKIAEESLQKGLLLTFHFLCIKKLEIGLMIWIDL